MLPNENVDSLGFCTINNPGLCLSSPNTYSDISNDPNKCIEKGTNNCKNR